MTLSLSLYSQSVKLWTNVNPPPPHLDDALPGLRSRDVDGLLELIHQTGRVPVGGLGRGRAAEPVTVLTDKSRPRRRLRRFGILSHRATTKAPSLCGRLLPSGYTTTTSTYCRLLSGVATTTGEPPLALRTAVTAQLRGLEPMAASTSLSVGTDSRPRTMCTLVETSICEDAGGGQWWRRVNIESRSWPFCSQAVCETCMRGQTGKKARFKAAA